ncbi:MAG TPA: DUF1194 domain-containing protein [Alphaproteobacteria bacterium]|nr:DUF1194 domain-containing protein [Alphaproteobacteria bacterium]
MRPAAILTALGLALGAAALSAGAAAETVDVELVLAADGSGSIDDAELRLQREGYANALASPQVLDAIRSGGHGAVAVAFVEWGGPGSHHVIVDWRIVRDEASARAFGEALLAAPRRAQGYNDIAGTIDFSRRLIETNAHEGARKVIDVSGDGPNINGRPVTAARDEAVLAGITVNALAIDPNRRGQQLDRYYESEVIGGWGSFVMVAENREAFGRAVLAKLVREIAAAPPPAPRVQRVAALAGE